MENIHSLPLIFDVPCLKDEVNAFLKGNPFHEHTSQLTLTHSLKEKTDNKKLYAPTGSLWDFEKHAYSRDPEKFNILNQRFKGTYLKEIYKEVCEWSELPTGRVRLTMKKPRTCYSIHFDEAIRHHLAIEIDEHNYIYFINGRAYQIPADGHLYQFDATKKHTAFNGSNCECIHLVFDCLLSEEESRAKRITTMNFVLQKKTKNKLTSL